MQLEAILELFKDNVSNLPNYDNEFKNQGTVLRVIEICSAITLWRAWCKRPMSGSVKNHHPGNMRDQGVNVLGFPSGPTSTPSKNSFSARGFPSSL